MVTIIFTFDLRSGHVQVKSQILRKKLSFKTYISCLVLSQDSKNAICFVVRQLEIPKIENQKTSLPLLGFWAIAQLKIKILAWSFVHMLEANSSITHISFFGYLLYFQFLGIHFWKKWNLDLGVKNKISKIRDMHFVEHIIWHLLVSVDCISLKNPIFQKHLNIGRFSTQNRVTSLKRHFFQNLLDGFRWNFVWRCQINA